MSTHVMQGTLAHDKETGERVAAVMADESEVAHKWAAQSQTHGRFRAIYFSGRVLYSYGSHYIIGRIEEPDSGIVLLNAESNSMTTNGHRRAAEHATRHKTQLWIPDLTAALRLADNVRSYRESVAYAKREGMTADSRDSYLAGSAERLKRAKTEGRSFVRDIFERGEELSDDSAVYLLGLYGWPRTSLAAIKREAEKRAKAAKLAEERRAKARALEDAKRFGDCSADEFREFMPADSYSYQREQEPGTLGRLADGNGASAQKSFAKRVARAHKASKAAGYTSRTRQLWARVKEAREHAAGFERRERQRKARELREEFEQAREAGTLASLPAWRFPDSMAAEINAAQEAKKREEAAAAYASWQETPTACERPDSRRFAEDSLERRVLEGFEREEIEQEAAAFERWRVALATAKRRGDPKPAWPLGTTRGVTASSFATRWPDIAERLGGDPWREHLHGWTLAEAEAAKAREAEAERLRHASEAERRAAWIEGASLAGYHRLSDESGGALLRIEGEGGAAELVTSHGARVPLSDAIAAFRFVKLIRQRGEGWQRNGRRVRVGSYQLDSIQPSGDFIAGCHRINWPEIERVAKLAEVFELEPSDAAEAKPAHA